jgi:L-malate glycosyltransferase
VNASLPSLATRPAEPLDARRHQPGGRLRLLLLTDTPILASGGSERFLRQLLLGLDPRRYSIDVVQLCPPPGDAAESSTLPIPPQVRLEYWPVDAVYGARGRALYRELRRRLLRGDYDLVQSQHEKSDLLCALLPRGPANARRISNRRDTGFQKSTRLRLAFGLLNRRFDALVGPADAVLQPVRRREGGVRCPTTCIPNGVDTERFRPLPPVERQAARAALQLDPDTFVFVCVARLVEVKRHCDLLRAFARLDREARPSQLWLVGDGPLRGVLEQQARDAGIDAAVRFLGERHDVDALLPLCDALVLASLTEGMSNAVLEAMACGLPVVATAVGGQAEVVEDGVTGLLVPAHSPVRLAFALEELLHAPARSHQMGRQARQRALECFSLRSMVQQFEQLHQRLCPTHARA